MSVIISYWLLLYVRLLVVLKSLRSLTITDCAAIHICVISTHRKEHSLWLDILFFFFLLFFSFIIYYGTQWWEIHPSEVCRIFHWFLFVACGFFLKFTVTTTNMHCWLVFLCIDVDSNHRKVSLFPHISIKQKKKRIKSSL